MTTEPLWVLQWSHAQNALRAEPVELAMMANRLAYRDDKAGDFRPLYIGSRELVCSVAESMRTTLAKREFGLEAVPA